MHESSIYQVDNLCLKFNNALFEVLPEHTARELQLTGSPEVILTHATTVIQVRVVIPHTTACALLHLSAAVSTCLCV